MIISKSSLIPYNQADKSRNFFWEAKQGSFWHLRRLYILKDRQNQIYSIQVNIFQRIYANLFKGGVENYFKTIFSDRAIIGLIPEKELDLFVYNTLRSDNLKKGEKIQSLLASVYGRIELQSIIWPGKSTMNLPIPNSLRANVPCQREIWWGEFAKFIGSTGLNTLIDQVKDLQPGIALDTGCGNSASAIHLLQKGWTVICLDYSQAAITAMERANEINQEWLKTNQLRLIHSNIESYAWSTKVDLILVSSALPYFDPSKIKMIMSNIYQNLKSNGYFIGNFFALKYMSTLKAVKVSLEMGAWSVPDKDSVGYLLAGHGYEVIECDKGGPQNPHSVIFIGKKT